MIWGMIEMEAPKRFIERDFLVGRNPTWTEILRDRQNREALRDLRKRLQKAKFDEEKSEIRESLRLMEAETRQWAVT